MTTYTEAGGALTVDEIAERIRALGHHAPGCDTESCQKNAWMVRSHRE